ncbi:MAG: response regulator [Ignavibacteria bacterium]
MIKLENQDKAKVKILIVEDEFVLSIYIKRAIEKLGYSVVGHAKTGEIAIQIAKEKIPDLVIMDINLGNGIDGIETARQILKMSAIPIIFSTGNSDSHTVERANRVCQDGFLTKPYQPEQLKKAIESVLMKSKSI